jgi:hypothetical protein
VRKHFGFKLDTRDYRFKEMLEKKEKEDKKKQKKVKRHVKKEKMIESLTTKNKDFPDVSRSVVPFYSSSLLNLIYNS